MTTISDETLMALADGELDAGEAARVRQAIDHDAALAARFASFVETRALLAAGGGEADEAVPERLIMAARGLGEALARNSRSPTGIGVGSPSSQGDVTRPGGPARNDNIGAPRRHGRFTWPIAIAASVALVVGGFVGYLAGTATAQLTPTQTAASGPGLATSPALSARLSELVSGETREFTEPESAAPIEITIVSTHRMNQGGICREFALRQGGARQMRVACFTDNAWQTRLVVALPAADHFTPAGGNETADQFLEASGSSEVLTGEAERQAIKR